jgi:flavin reductase (DIM6/NTAB) family NADH-FMN oxidoreductase RutF
LVVCEGKGQASGSSEVQRDFAASVAGGCLTAPSKGAVSMRNYSYRVGDGHGLRHNPLKAVVAPRPIGWISSLSRRGIANLAPYSFFNMVNDSPPLLMFSSVSYKDSIRNVEETGEFIFNLATMLLAEQMNSSSAAFSQEIDEFEAAGLQKGDALVVNCPRVATSPAALECKTVEVRRLRDIRGQQVDAWMAIGEVVAVHLDRDCIDDGMFRTELAGPIMRAGYASEYWAIGKAGKFEMWRPNGNI